MNKKILTLTTIIFLSHLINGQVPYYKSLQSNGNPSFDYTSASSENYKKDRQSFTNKNDKYQNKFSLNSAFGIEKMLLSGNVIYGDSITNYLNELLDKILENKKDIRSKIRIYTMKSSIVNAYSTASGIIFVTTGLISKIKHEGQLSFILCHEISHYIKKHSYSKFVKIENTNVNSSNYLSILKYSKDLEKEADDFGLELYINAGYSFNYPISSLQMLQKSNYWIEDIEFNFKQFNDSFYKIPESMLNEKKVPFNINYEEDDLEHTHPNIQTRVSNIYKHRFTKNKGIIHNLLPEEYLKKIIKLSHFEMAYCLITENKAMDALYFTVYLDSAYGFNYFTENIKIQSLQLISQGYKNSDYVKEGNFYKFSEIINNFSNYELSLLALRLTLKYNHDFALFKRKECLINCYQLNTEFENCLNKRDSIASPYYLNSLSSFYNKDNQSVINVNDCKIINKRVRLFDISKSDKNNDKCMNIDSILFYNPSFDSYNLSNKVKKNYLADEKQEVMLATQFEKYCKKIGIKSEYLFLNDKENLTVEKLNNNNLLQVWLIEINSISSNVSAFTQLEINKFSESKNINHLALTNFDVQISKDKMSAIEYVALLYPPFLIYALVHYTDVKKDLNFSYLVFDFKTGNIEILKLKSFEDSYKKDIVKSHIFNLLFYTKCN